MNLKSEKGVTSIDVVTATIIITIFISILSVVFYNVSKTGKELERKSEAIHIAQSIIEEVKTKDYDVVNLTKATNNTGEIDLAEKDVSQYKFSDESTLNISIPEGYTATIKVENYVPEVQASAGESNEGTIEEKSEVQDDDVVKIVTVNVQYKVGKEIQNTELSTEIVKYVN